MKLTTSEQRLTPKHLNSYISNFEPVDRVILLKKQNLLGIKGIRMLEENINKKPVVSSGLQASLAGSEKLAELNVDPIVELLNQVQQIDELIALELQRSNVRITEVARLVALKTTIYQTILPYRYGKAPTTSAVETERGTPLTIILTGSDSD